MRPGIFDGGLLETPIIYTFACTSFSSLSCLLILVKSFVSFDSPVDIITFLLVNFWFPISSRNPKTFLGEAPTCDIPLPSFDFSPYFKLLLRLNPFFAIPAAILSPTIKSIVTILY